MVTRRKILKAKAIAMNSQNLTLEKKKMMMTMMMAVDHNKCVYIIKIITAA
jgi:hypothetical protein